MDDSDESGLPPPQFLGSECGEEKPVHTASERVEEGDDDNLRTWHDLGDVADFADGKSYTLLNPATEALSSPRFRRQVVTAAALSEHAYKCTSRDMSPDDAFQRLELLNRMWHPILDLRGGVQVLHVAKAPPLVTASDSDTVYVAFRGSKEGMDWLSDIHVRMARFSPAPAGCNTHAGFCGRGGRYPTTLLLSIWQEAAQRGMEVVLTGHSLGGAVAGLKLAEMQLAGREGTKAVTFGTPFWGNAALAKFLGEKGISPSIHNFFHPCDRIPASTSPFGFVPVGYQYYTSVPVLGSWLSQQFTQRAWKGLDTPPPPVARCLTTAMFAGGVVVAVVASPHMMRGGRRSRVPPELQQALAQSPYDSRQMRVRDWAVPYFVALATEVVVDGLSHPRQIRPPEEIEYASLCDGTVPGVFCTAAPGGPLFKQRKGFVSEVGNLMLREKRVSTPPPSVEFEDQRHHVFLRFDLHPSGGIFYTINGTEPRPPLTLLNLDFNPSLGRYVLSFPELGPEKAAHLPNGDELPSLLSRLARLADAGGAHHNLRRVDLPSPSLLARLSTAVKGVKAAGSSLLEWQKHVKAVPRYAVDVLKETHRIQMYTLALLFLWGDISAAQERVDDPCPSALTFWTERHAEAVPSPQAEDSLANEDDEDEWLEVA
eukprot:Sspe_Gene.69915::Locus_41263_Transcript_1_1_Confidence_1.000_Length_2242::g.69915::m.69915